MPFWLLPLIIAIAALSVFLWARHHMGIPPEKSTLTHMPLLPIAFAALLVIILCGAYVLGHIRGPV